MVLTGDEHCGLSDYGCTLPSSSGVDVIFMSLLLRTSVFYTWRIVALYVGEY